MKNNWLKIPFLFAVVIFLYSCTQRFLDFTLVSSKNVDLTKCGSLVRGKSRVTGKDKVHWIIIIPTGTVSIKEAIDKAIESTPGCVALLDGVVYTKFWWVPYIYGQQSAVVEGTPLIDPSLVQNGTETPAFGKIELNRHGEITNAEEISSAEFDALKSKVVKETQETAFASSEELR